MCMGIGVLSVNNASAGKDLNKKQILKTISKTKKEIKNLNKKIKAVKKATAIKQKVIHMFMVRLCLMTH